MAKIKEREKALELRKEGFSISEIAKRLKVSKSTVSLWCRDVVLSEVAILKIVKDSNAKSTLGILRYTESLRKKRQINVKRDKNIGACRLGQLTERDIYCLGLGLYWGEGYKQGSQEFGFTNSDPKMIIFYLKWLKVVFSIRLESLILRVSINETHSNRINLVQKFWSNTTGIQLSQFTLPSLIKIKSKKVYKDREKHYGTLRVKVRKGTRMRREVLGAIESLSNVD